MIPNAGIGSCTKLECTRTNVFCFVMLQEAARVSTRSRINPGEMNIRTLHVLLMLSRSTTTKEYLTVHIINKIDERYSSRSKGNLYQPKLSVCRVTLGPPRRAAAGEEKGDDAKALLTESAKNPGPDTVQEELSELRVLKLSIRIGRLTIHRDLETI